MQILDAKEKESFSKIDLKDVLSWMPIKKACRLGAPVTSKLQKKGASP
jgi:hypothetical protein